MSWLLGRLGSRFSLFFEPHQRRVMHAATGRCLDQPLDLAVGLIEPDGTERVMPFTAEGEPLDRLEQFERVNSITFRGESARTGLRLELNVHSVFYPEDEPLCVMPAFYLELRLNPAGSVEPEPPQHPERLRVFLRVSRPETAIEIRQGGHIDMRYESPALGGPPVSVAERITSLNEDCGAGDKGLWLDMPVTPVGSGIKWRLVWGAHTDDAVFNAPDGRRGFFRYNHWWGDLDAVMKEAIESRDQRLLLSRRFEKMIDQTSLDQAERHLVHQGFQNAVASTAWCDLEDGTPWFATWDNADRAEASPDVAYHAAPFFLAVWPDLLAQQLRQAAAHEVAHAASGGSFLRPRGRSRPGKPVSGLESAAHHLLLLQAYAHWTGDVAGLAGQEPLIERLGRYLLWTDREGTGFPPDEAAVPTRGLGPSQTGLAVKRATGLQAAADLLAQLGHAEAGGAFESAAEKSIPLIEASAWVGDHYALAARTSDPFASEAAVVPSDGIQARAGWDGYTVDATDGLTLPALIGRPLLLDPERMVEDLVNATRETLRPYGCDQTSVDPDAIRVSQNIWRDLLARYVHAPLSRFSLADRYWELQLVDNTSRQSAGFVDAYVGAMSGFDASGGVALGYLLAGPRLVIDRLAPGGQRILVDPDREAPGRFPLLPMADWQAGKIPICVVDRDGRVIIENESDPVIVRGEPEREVIG